MEVNKAVVVTLEVMNKALDFLQACKFKDVAPFLIPLIQECNATLHEVKQKEEKANDDTVA